MIKMKALRPGNIGDGATRVKRGREFMVAAESRAKELEDEGLAYRIETKIAAPALNKMEPPPSNKAAETGPLDFHGGAIGADAPAPSLPLDPPRRRRRSPRLKDEDLP